MWRVTHFTTELSVVESLTDRFTGREIFHFLACVCPVPHFSLSKFAAFHKQSYIYLKMCIFPLCFILIFPYTTYFCKLAFCKKKNHITFIPNSTKTELTTTLEHMESDSKTLFWFFRPLRELWELHKNVTRDMSGTLHWSSVVELSQPGDTKCSSLSLSLMKPVTLWMSSAKDFLHVYCLETYHFGKIMPYCYW